MHINNKDILFNKVRLCFLLTSTFELHSHNTKIRIGVGLSFLQATGEFDF